MKTMRMLVISAAAFLAAASVWGQGSDSFTGSTINSGSWSSTTGGVGLLSQSNQLFYSTSGTPTTGDYSLLTWSGHPTYATSWSAQVDVLVPNLSITNSSQEYSVGINVQGGSGSPSDNYNFSITLAPYYTTSFHSEYDSDLVTAGSTAYHPTSGQLSQFQTTSNSAALKVDYNATTHVVSTYFDDDGSAGGYTWTQVLSWNIASGGTGAPGGTTGGWGMSASDTFNISLLGSSASFAVSTGDGLALDNFSTTVSAVPEPSTYAAIFGALALSAAMIQRRRQRQA